MSLYRQGDVDHAVCPVPGITDYPSGLHQSEKQWQRDSCSSAGSGDGSGEPDDSAGTAYTLEKRPEMKHDWYATVERKNRARKQQQLQQQQQQAEQVRGETLPLTWVR